MARVGANHPQATAALHVPAVHADFLNRCFDFHVFEYHRISLPPKESSGGRDNCYGLGTADDPSPAAVRIELQLHTIADEHFYSMQTHFSGQVRKYRVTVFELYAKERIWKGLFNDPFRYFCFSHICGTKNSNSG